MGSKTGILVQKKKNKVSSYVLVVALTVLTYYTLVGIWPFLYNIFLTFRKTDLITTDKFIGFKNYGYLVKDPIFLKSLLHNIVYLFVLVGFGIVTSLFIALLISNTSGGMKKLYTAMFFAPVVTSMVAISLVWSLLYFPKIGVFANVINAVIGKDRNTLTFLQNPSTALLWIIFMDMWRDTGIRVVIFLAGMDEIPDSLYESAVIAGASKLRQFFKITMPLLIPQIVFIVAVFSINAIRVYVPVYMMTGSPPGGPANSTIVLGLHMYLRSFYGQRFGYGATISMVMFVILFGLVLLEIKAMRKDWEY